MFFRRYYPHHHYFGIHGYRGAYYGSSFGGGLLAFGIIFLIIGIALEWDYGTLFNGFFIAGLLMIILGILLAVMMSSRLNRMRMQHSEFDSPDRAPSMSAPSGSSSLDGFVTGAPSAPPPAATRTGRCPSCGGSGSGEFCSFCGSRLG
jgi:hypothetical protein